MPALGKADGGPLARVDIEAVLGYLRTQAGVPPAPSGPGAPSAGAAGGADGKTLYAKACSVCHGQNGGQFPNANLASKAYLDQKGDAQLRRATAEGVGGMPPMGKAKGGVLSDEEVAAVVEYLKSAAKP